LKKEDLKAQVQNSTDTESPLNQSLAKQSGYEDKLPSFDADSKGIAISPTQTGHELSGKAKADFYLSLVEAKLTSAAKANGALAPEVNHLIASLKQSIEEMGKNNEEGASPILPAYSNVHNTSGNSENFSPKFGKDQYAIPSSPSEDNTGRKSLSKSHYKDAIKPMSAGPAQEPMSWSAQEEEKLEDQGSGRKTNRDDEIEDGLLLKEMEEGEESEDDDEHQSAASYDSLVDEIQIDRNQEYLLEIKNMLGIKALTQITDPFTRELITQMGRGKKKVCAIRLKKAVKLRNKEEIEVETKSFFRDACEKKILHFFRPCTKYLHLFNLARPFDVMEEKSTEITLDIDFDISPHYKSLITPSGLIFIVSGKTQPTSIGLDDSTGSLHVYNYNGRTLIEKPSMSVQRIKNFGLTYMSKNLFVIGGIVNGIISNYGERYDIRSNEWLEIAPMNKKLKDVSVCGFNNRFIYRFFGVDANNMVDNSIERYDAVRDKWTLMNVSIPEGLRGIHMPLCTQINQDYIFVFGGRTSTGYPSRNSKGYVMKVEDKKRSNTARISETKSFVAGLAGNFSQNNMIAHSGDILFLRESF